MTLPERVCIVEVGPRDGLQNESVMIDSAVKVALVQALAAAGLTEIEATSFVHPRAVPQLADAGEVMAKLPVVENVRYSALVPNQRGLERAIEAGVTRIAVFTAASETFARRNINMTIDESLAQFAPVVRDALAANVSVRGYVSTCFECPYEGQVDPGRVKSVSTALLDMGVDEIAIGDTIGAAGPGDIQALFEQLLRTIPVEQVALHLHDTYGTALVNVYAGLLMGITTFDSSAGGLGGCPYAPGAAGNLATEDLVYLLDSLGIKTGVSLESVFAASRLIATALDRPLLPSKQFQRLASRCERP